MEEKLITSGKIAAAVTGLKHPIVGVLGTAFFEALSYRSAQKQSDLIRDVVAELESGGFLRIDELLTNKRFLDAMLTACAIANYTRRLEKIQRIRNALVYCAWKSPPEDELDAFFHLLDQLSEECFIVLQVIADHLAEFAAVETVDQLYRVFNEHHPRFSKDAFGHYLYELKYRRLVRISDRIKDSAGHLQTTAVLLLEHGADGDKIIISEVARQLLRITNGGG